MGLDIVYGMIVCYRVWGLMVLCKGREMINPN